MMQIRCVDVIEGLQSLHTGSINIVITSPPYNRNTKYNTYKDNLDRNVYLDWMEEVGSHLHRVLTNDGSFFLNIGNSPSDQWIAYDVANRIRSYFKLQNTITWIKAINDKGHFKPINSSKYLNQCYEYVFHFTKHGNVALNKLAIGVPFTDKSNIERWKGNKSDVRDRGNTWFIPYKTVQSKKPHPAQFSPELPEMCIKLHGIKDNTMVLDPFCGLSNTGIACKILGVSYIGFDIDEEYVRESNNIIKTFINNRSS